MMQGQCLCGAVSYEVEGKPQGASVCHCSQCRRQSGHLWASAYVLEDLITIKGPVRWFEASEEARRGFCPKCGSSLFWQAHDEDTISFSLGSLNDDSEIKLQKHIFVASKGDYYDIADGLPIVGES
ncbi:GFA family protein [Roseovarius albus]|nr:GFA family protein [Roseovarius albus]